MSDRWKRREDCYHYYDDALCRLTGCRCTDRPCARCIDYLDKTYAKWLESEGYRYSENKRAWEYGE